jgi:Predicted membrane protein
MQTGSLVETNKVMRLESIDLLRCIVMIIMALDHTRDYFHNSAFFFEPEDLGQTNVVLFLTRWITHICAPVFVFLAGTSAYLYGSKRSRKELSRFLFTRGLWLIFAELIILSLLKTFNPAYHFFNLQVIWAIGISMIVLSALIYLRWSLIFLTGLIIVVAHNLLDGIHVPGNNFSSFLWSVLHEPGSFQSGLLRSRYFTRYCPG